MNDNNANWLEIARELQALSQSGLTFSDNHFERDRYNRISEIASEIFGKYTEIDSEKFTDIFLDQKGYATPKIDVRAATIKEGKILLVKEAADGKWSMPGGWADVGDKPSEVAERETKEESGYIVKAQKIVGVFDANRSGRPLELFHAFKIIFLCEFVGGEAKASDETLDVGFFPLDNLPELSSNRTNERHLNEIKAHLENMERRTYFD
nr:NUDIX hydrolase [uncultured Sphaerochaeta sp.]